LNRGRTKRAAEKGPKQRKNQLKSTRKVGWGQEGRLLQKGRVASKELLQEKRLAEEGNSGEQKRT